MSNYIRARGGDTYFFTVVTYKRMPILCLESCRNILSRVIKEVQTSRPFKIEALVLLPEHIHCIWKLPEGDTDYSTRWALIKKEFTKNIKGLVGTAHPTRSQEHRRERTIWQRRFWEHQIRDEEDLNAHCNYIHYNPVKHSLVKSPSEWPYSTFHGFVFSGIYPLNWGADQEMVFDEHIGKE
jgi:putative transposase